MSNVAVQKAAEFLDKHCEHKDWRDRINIDELQMSSTIHCVLGQVYGDYSNGYDVLSDYYGWDAVNGAFCKHTEAWREYLTAERVKAADPYAGVEWIAQRPSTYNVVIDHSYELDGKTYVVYTTPGSPFPGPTTTSLESLKGSHQPKPEAPKYVVGRLYLSDDKQTVVMYAGGNRFHRLNTNFGYSVTFGDIEYFESQYGPLHVLTNNLGNYSGATLDVTITD